MEASDGSESVAARRVRTRRTWTLSMACGVSGWLLIACMIVWGVVNILMAANEDGATLRDYGFVVAIFLVLLLLFVINVIGALVGFRRPPSVSHAQRGHAELPRALFSMCCRGSLSAPGRGWCSRVTRGGLMPRGALQYEAGVAQVLRALLV